MPEPFDDLDEIEYEVVTMLDDDGEEIEFSIIDNVTSGSDRYLLVVETEALDDDDDDDASYALILKEISINSDDVTYDLLEEDAEFDRIAELFAKKGDEYEVQID
ncbi:MAG: DUF1292 domain-containing protein [Bacillota bacterium]